MVPSCALIGSITLVHRFSPSCCWTNHTLIPCHLCALTWITPLKSSTSSRNNFVSSPRTHLEDQIPGQPVRTSSHPRTISKRERSKTNPLHSTSARTLLPQTMRTRRQASSTRFEINKVTHPPALTARHSKACRRSLGRSPDRCRWWFRQEGLL